MKKYTLLKHDSTEVNGTKLYRIQACKSFGDVSKGDLGGYIEKESNLSHEGNCWVSDNALVFENARVSGDARVYDNAWIRGDAQVSGNARVYEDAQVCENVHVYGDAEVYGYARVFENAWVSDNALVYGNARVYGDAWVFGEAQVSGNARVYGEAKVYGNARVYGDAEVYGDARVFGDALVYGAARVFAGYITMSLSNTKFSLAAQLGVAFVKNKVVLYKRVVKRSKGVYVSRFDKNFVYKDGKISRVTDYDSSDESCAKGIHLSTALYWNEGDTLIACEVHKNDVITVQQGKVRCKKCRVIGEVKF